MADKKTGMTLPAGILRPTMPPDDIPQDEEQGASVGVSQDPKSRATRKNKVTVKASSGKVEGRKLYLTEDIHFRLRMLAYQNGQKLSECAAEVLDRALPKWDVSRLGTQPEAAAKRPRGDASPGEEAA